MAERDGVPVRDVLVADASRRTNALNAYVSGLGPTRRIVVYDTLLREAPPAEVRAVVAHELGHAKDRDVLTGTLIGALGAAAAVCAVYLIGSWTPLLRRAGVESITDPRAVALLLALATLAGLAASPLQSFVSRRIEARADGHALALTEDPATVERMEQRLATTNLADVDPPRLEYLFFASHPVRRGAHRRRPGLRAGRAMSAGRTLLVTNDFPPRAGGIQQFVHNLAVRRPPGSLVVYASRWKGWEKFDAEAPFPVIREETSVLLPTAAVARRTAEIAREHGCDRVWFGAAAPLGLLAAGLRERAGITRAVALTHGHEVGWAALPGARGVLRRIGRGVDVVTYLGEYTRVRLARVLGDLTTLERLAPGVDTDAFSPDVGPRPGAGRARAHRPAGGRVRLPARAPQGAGHADPGAAGHPPPGARRGAAAGRWRPVPPDPRAPGRRARRGRPCRLHRWRAVGRVCRPTTRPATSSRCRAGPDGAAWMSRASASSTWRRRRPDFRWWPVTPVAPPTRYGPTRPGTSWPGATSTPWPSGWALLLSDRALARRMGATGRRWVEAQWRWETQAARLSDTLSSTPLGRASWPRMRRLDRVALGARDPSARRPGDDGPRPDVSGGEHQKLSRPRP